MTETEKVIDGVESGENQGGAFSWIEPFKQIASALHDLQEDRGRLQEIFSQLGEMGQGEEADPLTFLSLFNHGNFSDGKRIEMVSRAIDLLGLSCEPPSDFDGVPLNNAFNWRYQGGNPADTDFDWEVFIAAIECADKKDIESGKRFEAAFDAALGRKNIGKAKLTMALFWARPESFLPLDSSTCSYLDKVLGIRPLGHFCAAEYLRQMAEVRKRTESPFHEISLAAYLLSKKDSPFFRPIEQKTKRVPSSVELQGNVALNTILFGPPGTGKTYMTTAYAVAICDGRKLEEVKAEMGSPSGYNSVKTRFEQLRESGRIEMVTFHQSYGYEDFVEGIRPNYNDEKGVLEYPVVDGAFVRFCREAQVFSSTTEIEGVTLFGDNLSPRVWCVHAQSKKLKDLAKRCIDNGCIRIGGSNVAPENVRAMQEKAQGRRSMLMFQEEMRKGDFLVMPNPEGGIMNVGVVTGDFRWRDEFAHAKRYRDVSWFGKVSRETFVAELGGVIPPSDYWVSLQESVSPRLLLGFIGRVAAANALANRPSTDARVFIIDEINRGNVSKIMGELITLLEPSKRLGARESATVRLPFSQTEFSVPKNVFVIGTMNTADRSLTRMDAALRRRFDFVEMLPQEQLLDGVSVEGVDVGRLMGAMNARIEALYDREHMLGHAVFMGLVEEGRGMADLAAVFDRVLIPLLQEYFFDDYERIRSVLGAAADSFVERVDSAAVFWDEDPFAPEEAVSYRVKPAPCDPAAYVLIYDASGGKAS